MSVGAIGCPANAALALSTKIAITDNVARIETPTPFYAGNRRKTNIHYRCDRGHRASSAMKSYSAGLPQSHAHDEPSDGAVGPQQTFRTWPDVPVALTFAPGPLLPSTAREGLARTRERRHHSVVDGRMVRIIDPTAGGSAGRCTPRVRVGSFATAVRPIIHVRLPADADTHRHRHCQFNESFGRRTANSYATG